MDRQTKDKPPVGRMHRIGEFIGSPETIKRMQRESNKELLWTLAFGIGIALLLIAIIWYKFPNIDPRTVSCDYWSQTAMSDVPARCIAYFQGR